MATKAYEVQTLKDDDWCIEHIFDSRDMAIHAAKAIGRNPDRAVRVVEESLDPRSGELRWMIVFRTDVEHRPLVFRAPPVERAKDRPAARKDATFNRAPPPPPAAKTAGGWVFALGLLAAGTIAMLAVIVFLLLANNAGIRAPGLRTAQLRSAPATPVFVAEFGDRRGRLQENHSLAV